MFLTTIDARTFERSCALTSVNAERDRQDERWGAGRDLDAGTWYFVLGEEVGEVARAVLDAEPVDHLSTELIQVAAVCLSWVEAINRQEAANRV